MPKLHQVITGFAGYGRATGHQYINTLDPTKSVSASICLSFIDMRKGVLMECVHNSLPIVFKDAGGLMF